VTRPISTSDDLLGDLIIDLNPLTRTVLSHSLDVEVSQAGVQQMLAATDAQATGAGGLSLSIQHIGSTTLLVRGDFSAGLCVPCARCLEPASARCVAELCVQAVQGAVAASPPPSDSAKSSAKKNSPKSKAGKKKDRDEEEEVEVDLDAPDTLTYSGHTLDLRELVTEQVAMAYPMRILCSLGEACRGLCHSCGSNLNDLHADGCSACRGSQEAPAADPENTAQSPWKAALRAIQEREGDT